jgi:hypothetical protein
MADGGVFINYRSADCHSYGALLYAELSRRFGTELVFLDNESIPAGSDFVADLLQRVRGAWIVLALIGPDWLTAADEQGSRRLDDPTDWIRRELAEAFAVGGRVIPVLVDGAPMPVESQLPPDIASLGRCQFRRLRYREAGSDIARLIADLTAVEPRLVPRPTDEPKELVVVGRPPLRADAFQERPPLRDALADGATARTGTVTQVITGDGGTGKTQLAAAEFTAALPAVDIAMWVTTGSRSAVLSAYAQTFTAIHAIPSSSDEGQAEQQATQLLGWLAATRRRWLIVMDDLVDPAALRGLWPSGPGGRVVVTTRRRDAALLARGQVIDVNTFTPPESVAYLAAKLDKVPGAPVGVLEASAELTADLGHLPLALSHAAATIINDGITCADYRALLADGAHRLSDLLPADPSEAGEDYAHTVSGTWSLARDRADRLAPAGLAGPMLDVIAFLDPNGTPEAVLTSEPVRAHLTDGGTSAEGARRAIRNLRRLSLVTHDPNDPARSVRMHALAQRAGIENLSPDASTATIRVAADALLRIWPAFEAGTPLGQVLRANASVLISRLPTALWRPTVHPLLFRTGNSLADSGLIADAAAYFTELTANASRHLGADHPDTLRARHRLAGTYGPSGDLIGARTAYRDLLSDQSRVLGAEHRDTLATRADLGWWQGMAGDAGGAVSAFRALLADRTRVLGPDHPDTLATRNHLARWRGGADDLIGAIEAFECLLLDEIRLLGADHPDTLTTRNNLAHVRGRAGDPDGAAAEIEQVLAARIQLLGPDHPRTLTTRAHVARWRGEAGDPAGAAKAFEAVLTDELRVLGPDHLHHPRQTRPLAWRGRGSRRGGRTAGGRTRRPAPGPRRGPP